jgi:hypothetical protein
MRSFVLGNGRSRLSVRPHELKKYGKIYGCNALYREFEPDYLIAVDPKMVVEIEKTGYQKKHEVWTNPNSKYRNYQGFNYFHPSLGWSSGPTALDLAVKHGALEIYIFGFDLQGIKGYLNNVYADTPNYRKSSDVATYYGNWQRQTEQVIKKNYRIKFFRVVDKDFFNPDWSYANFRHITYDELYRVMPTWQQNR